MLNFSSFHITFKIIRNTELEEEQVCVGGVGREFSVYLWSKPRICLYIWSGTKLNQKIQVFMAEEGFQILFMHIFRKFDMSDPPPT